MHENQILTGDMITAATQESAESFSSPESCGNQAVEAEGGRRMVWHRHVLGKLIKVGAGRPAVLNTEEEKAIVGHARSLPSQALVSTAL